MHETRLHSITNKIINMVTGRGRRAGTWQLSYFYRSIKICSCSEALAADKHYVLSSDKRRDDTMRVIEMQDPTSFILHISINYPICRLLWWWWMVNVREETDHDTVWKSINHTYYSYLQRDNCAAVPSDNTILYYKLTGIWLVAPPLLCYYNATPPHHHLIIIIIIMHYHYERVN